MGCKNLGLMIILLILVLLLLVAVRVVIGYGHMWLGVLLLMCTFVILICDIVVFGDSVGEAYNEFSETYEAEFGITPEVKSRLVAVDSDCLYDSKTGLVYLQSCGEDGTYVYSQLMSPNGNPYWFDAESKEFRELVIPKVEVD